MTKETPEYKIKKAHRERRDTLTMFCFEEYFAGIIFAHLSHWRGSLLQTVFLTYIFFPMPVVS